MYSSIILLYLTVQAFYCSTYGWDLAVSSPGRIVLANVTGDVESTLLTSAVTSDARGLAMDLEDGVLFFAGSENASSIFSWRLGSNETHSALVLSQPDEYIQSLIFDPVERKLYWTDSDLRAIFWSSVASTQTSAQMLLKFESAQPQGLALDHCRRILFWTNSNAWGPSIERVSLLDTSLSPEKIVDSDLFQPLGLVVDPAGRGRLFWGHDLQGVGFAIEMSRLDGTDRRQLFSGNFHKPFSLAKVADMLFWSDLTHSAVWSLNISIPKGQRELQKVMHFGKENPYSVLAYPSADVCIKVDDLAPLEVTTPSTTVITTPEVTTEIVPVTSAFRLTSPSSHQLDYRSVEHLYCLAGGRLRSPEVCECPEGYAGSRCEQNLCLNYCLHGGVCTPGMPPECQCSAGRSGPRCELDACHNVVCLNGGSCQVLPSGKAKCECDSEFSGERCGTASDNSTSISRLRQDTSEQLCAGDASQQSNFYYIVLSLAAVCLTLLIVVGALTWRVVVLSRRPRIRRRVVVSRKEMSVPKGHSGEPGSSRRGVQHGDTCEITIENCCNMNICETPCFEPPVRSPGKVSKKDEKKNLLANMEDPDSQ